MSLDAQRDRLRTYCKLNAIKLIDIKADEGYSRSTLDRPGLQAALHMLRRGRANTLLVAKLDRLSRSLRDVCTLVDELFSDERTHLLSLCGMVNTHSAAGRMVLMNLANFCQFERELISERTRDALQHMKAQGIRLGPAHYGYTQGEKLDANGRRVLVPVESEQAVIAKMVALRAEGLSFNAIGMQLLQRTSDPAARRHLAPRASQPASTSRHYQRPRSHRPPRRRTTRPRHPASRDRRAPGHRRVPPPGGRSVASIAGACAAGVSTAGSRRLATTHASRVQAECPTAPDAPLAARPDRCQRPASKRRH